MKGAEPALAELSPGGWDRLTGSQVKKRNTYPRSCDMPLENNKAEEVGEGVLGVEQVLGKGQGARSTDSEGWWEGPAGGQAGAFQPHQEAHAWQLCELKEALANLIAANI